MRKENIDNRVAEIFKDLCDAPTGCVKDDFTIGTLKESHTDLFIRIVAGHLVSLNYSKQIVGEWVEETEYYDDDYSEYNVRKVFACSKCGRTEKRKEPYCNCGAKMKVGAK